VRILILGGTRFLGRKVAETLAIKGHELTLLSRRTGSVPPGARQVCAERKAGLDALKGSRFDLVLDFICHDAAAGPADVAASVAPERYVLISSTWVPRLWSGDRADEPGPGSGRAAANLPPVTMNYLGGKVRAEQAVATLRDAGRDAVSLRLPIMLGEGDHTGRFDFYRHRLADGGPLIAVAGGYNTAQIAVMEDLAQALVRWLEVADIGDHPIWEGLPGEGRSVRNTLERMATSAGTKARLMDVPVAELARDFPVYLEQEPFWRESALAVTEANIYSAASLVPAIFGDELPALVTIPTRNLRIEELRFLANQQTN
jgi:nucleoside-diphosphate-sugar epimerase